LLLLLDREDICASSGSACLADSEEASHVIQAMKPETDGRNTLRFSLGMSNTMEEIALIVKNVRSVVSTLT
jgi:cysteine desulfurase